MRMTAEDKLTLFFVLVIVTIYGVLPIFCK